MDSGASNVTAPLARCASSEESEFYTPTPPTKSVMNDSCLTEAAAAAWRKFVETGLIPDEVFAIDELRRKMIVFARGEINTIVTDEELATAADAPWAGNDEIQNKTDHLVTGTFVRGVFVPEYEPQFPVNPQHYEMPVIFEDEIQVWRAVPRFPLDANARIFVPGSPRHSRKRVRSE